MFEKIRYFVNFILILLKHGRKIKWKKIPMFGNVRNITVESSGRLILNGKFRSKNGLVLNVGKNGCVTFGKNVFFNNNCVVFCHKKIEIGDCTLFGPNVSLFDHDHVFSEEGVENNLFKDGEITIGKNCWIGAGSIILRNTHIGDCCVIGAGSIVKGEVPDHSLVTSSRQMNICPIQKKNGKVE